MWLLSHGVSIMCAATHTVGRVKTVAASFLATSQTLSLPLQTSMRLIAALLVVGAAKVGQ